MITVDFITALFYEVDEQLGAISKHPEAHLWPSEVVTLGLLHALKGVGNRPFYRWLTRDYRPLFPRLPERTRLFRLLKTHHNWTQVFLAAPTVLGVIDTYGIELIHPIREGRSPQQIGRKGLSNHRWIVGGKLCLLLNQYGLIVGWDCATANVPDKTLPGRAGGYPPGPPTDPDVRNSRIRFLRQSVSYPWILSSGGVVTRLASSESLSCIVPPGMLCPTSPSLPWVAWVSLPHVPWYYTTLRLPPALLGVLRLSLVPRYLACFPRSWCPCRARGQAEAPGHARAFGHPVPHSGPLVKETDGSPKFPSSPCEAMPRSQTPVVSCALAKAHPGLLPSGH
jgi:hypothetical protein